MIRLRIEKEIKTFSKEGLIWYNGGRPYQVIIEQSTMIPEANDQGFESSAFGWAPVEVIDES